MNDRSSGDASTDELRRGLRLGDDLDESRLARERAELVELEHAPATRRYARFLAMGGPAYLQAALTLGAGTALSALFAGAAHGYKLLWVAPTGMLMGVIVLSAVSWQTLSTGARPLAALREHVHPFFAWGLAIGAGVASIVWHFSQYSTASACLADAVEVLGWHDAPRLAAGLLVLGVAVSAALASSRSSRAQRLYERGLKWMVWSIVLCFGLVVVKTGGVHWGGLLRGFFLFEVPRENRGPELVLGGLAAAVGINMVFLYPYTLLARGWGREHRRLARFDLLAGMFVPYLLATSLLVIAAANTLYPFEGDGLKPHEMALALEPIAGRTIGRLLFNLGVTGMALTSISLHMLCCGFLAVELFGCAVGSRGWRLGLLVPTPGVLGAVLWDDKPLWIAVVTNVICGFLLPVAYVGFAVLQSRSRYLKDDLPRGLRGRIWLAALIAVTVFYAAFFVRYVVRAI